MPRYSNGLIALNVLVEFDSGNGQHWGTATTRARWYTGRENIRKRTGTTLHITPGWNVFRPYNEQVKARANACRQGNCNAAAAPGYSSHGGTWRSAKYTGGQWVDAFAIDVGDYARVPWSIFKEEMERVGFLVGAITPEIAGIFEPWHIIDLNPYGSWSGSESEDFDMPLTDAEIAKIAEAVWDKSYVQRQIDGKPTNVSMKQEIVNVPANVWARTVQRSVDGVPTPVSALQELADAKTLGIRSNEKLDSIQKNGVPVEIPDEVVAEIAAAVVAQIGKPSVTIDYAKIAADVRAKFTTDPLK